MIFLCRSIFSLLPNDVKCLPGIRTFLPVGVKFFPNSYQRMSYAYQWLLNSYQRIHGRVVAQFAVSDFQHRQLQNTLSRMRGFPRIRRSRRNRNTPLFLSSPPSPQSALKLRNIRNLKNFESSRCGPPPIAITVVWLHPIGTFKIL